jgi:hypothetical protein
MDLARPATTATEPGTGIAAIMAIREERRHQLIRGKWQETNAPRPAQVSV